ncbi:hypothetical protein [Sediminicola sp. YIK13]|uniref:hypothetical protein n=1 Tax=Sediminicola sp. YIK13 TaxID=1453352 RepID=UPI000782BAFF|nr:hypothetical protein [Sediminicola sp. YIK13]
MRKVHLIFSMFICGMVWSQTGNDLYLDNAKYIFAKTSSGTSTRTLGINSSDNLYLGSVDAPINNLFMNLNGQTRFSINGANGNIGIGTTNPIGKLEIYGANFNSTNLVLSANYIDKFRWRFNTIDRGNAIDLDFTASDSGDNQEAVLKLSRSNSGRPEFQLYNNTIVANNGNVGIGNEAPSEKLHVSGNILGNKLMINDPNEAPDWNLVWQSGFYQSYNGTNAPEPNQWFWGLNMNHSSNNSAYRYNGQIAIRNSATSPTMYFRSTDVNGNGVWSRILHREGNQFINGSLAIGTSTSGTHKLAVEGSIGAREIKVEATGWSDFVFEDNYKLPTLEEVEQHIKKYGHLKDIPSTREVEKNGINLGEMDARLLQKIEELTLYTIQQQKDINILQEKNREYEQLLEDSRKEKLKYQTLQERLIQMEERINSIKI